VNVSPYQDDQGLNWLIVTVLPDSEFTTEMRASTHQSINLILITIIHRYGDWTSYDPLDYGSDFADASI